MDELDNKEQKLTTKAVYDYKLVRLAIEKDDQKAYAELLHRYRESVYFTMLKMCNNKDDAEDLTIEAFGRAFKKLEQYSPDFAFSTWLFKIASNNAIDFLRKKKQIYALSIDNKFEAGEGSDFSASIKSLSLDPEETFIKKQKIENIRVLVDNLKPKYKEMIELFYFQELSHEEISKKLNLPLGTIKAQLFRARDLLYNAFQHNEKK
ncbi:RNA polymerase sigma factor [Aurantibacillus circumpalustris]|uniref:RNA polymerase sigma factor n=1 Tax=Aurantibacillus circumpalustris TaxID=3036359 RepID=UPI00295B51E4|nr:sigma-70 family RNA polymerase sigma factor [Aurantibacillus circumpalustris]